MPIIYEPKGRALEYAELAANLWTGCTHGCTYCFAPGVLRKTRDDFHAKVTPRKDVLKLLERDAKKFSGDPRRVMLCFTCDPYPEIEGELRITRHAMEILSKHDVKCGVLTKRTSIASRDFHLMALHDIHLGVSLSTLDEVQRRDWEPNADPIQSRQFALLCASRLGVYTWISIEPVWDTEQAIEVIRWAKRNEINHIKVGKMNHNKAVEDSIDWTAFLARVKEELKGTSHYIKADLAKYGE